MLTSFISQTLETTLWLSWMQWSIYFACGRRRQQARLLLNFATACPFLTKIVEDNSLANYSCTLQSRNPSHNSLCYESYSTKLYWLQILLDDSWDLITNNGAFTSAMTFRLHFESYVKFRKRSTVSITTLLWFSTSRCNNVGAIFCSWAKLGFKR